MVIICRYMMVLIIAGIFRRYLQFVYSSVIFLNFHSQKNDLGTFLG